LFCVLLFVDSKMKTEIDFNDNHPELRKGEIFLANIYVGYNPGIDDQKFGEIKYKSARLGWTSYDVEGNYLSNFQPVFVRKWDYYFNQYIWVLPILIIISIIASLTIA
jgi:hypothetical protein